MAVVPFQIKGERVNDACSRTGKQRSSRRRKEAGEADMAERRRNRLIDENHHFCLKVDLNVFSSTFAICVCGLHECLYVHLRSEDCPIFAGSSFYRKAMRFLLTSFVCI